MRRSGGMKSGDFSSVTASTYSTMARFEGAPSLQSDSASRVMHPPATQMTNAAARALGRINAMDFISFLLVL